MMCLSPFKVKTKEGIKDVPCGHCINCTIRKIEYNKFLAVKELQWCTSHNLGSAFVRLSYNDINLPVIYKGSLYRLGELVNQFNEVPKDFEPTLLKSDFIRFMKRLRKSIDKELGIKVKVCYCGEYGENNTERSHYHLILFGIDSLIAEKLVQKNWKYGFITSLPVESGAVSYMCKYMFHDVYGKEKQVKYLNRGIEPPFFYHSINMGKNVILDDADMNAESCLCNGVRIAYPKYIRDKYGLSVPKMKIKKYDNMTAEESEEFDKMKRAENYVRYCRQKGIPIDDRSLREKKSIVDTQKINNLIKEIDIE